MGEKQHNQIEQKMLNLFREFPVNPLKIEWWRP